MYVGTAEKDRLKRLNAPEDTVEKYEEMLPNAVALGMAGALEKRFAPVLAAAGYRSEWIDDFRFSNVKEKEDFSMENAAYASALAAVSAVAAACGASQRESDGFGGFGRGRRLVSAAHGRPW